MSRNGWWRYSRFGVLLVSLLMVTAFAAVAQRTGAWVDEVVMSEEPSESAGIVRLETGDIDIHVTSISDPELLARVEADPNIRYEMSFGSYNELSFNPIGPVFAEDAPGPLAGKLNPFSVPRVREAMNWLLDRDYIGGEIMGGLGVPKYTGLNSAFADARDRYPHILEDIEEAYAYDPAKAEAVITEEMEALGAYKDGGLWHFNGEPVEIIILIRNEDERLLIGDYVASQLEDIGFIVDRMERTAAEASPIWLRGEPADARMHMYTGGWLSTAVSRDQGTLFNQMYGPRVMPFPLFQALTPDPLLDELMDRLARRDYSSMEEREEIFEQVLWMAMEDSARVWLTDATGFNPMRADLNVAVDLAGGVSGSGMWGHTIHFMEEGEPIAGGSVNMTIPSILTDPWNPIGGSAWTFDNFPTRATFDTGVAIDTRDGLGWPLRIERGKVYVIEGLPAEATHDWVELEFVDEIIVPDDAIVDWDAEEQVFITAGEMYPEGRTARRKSIAYYPEDLWELPLHDGNTLSMGDIIMGMILTFDRAKEESPIFDEAYIPDYESFMRSFRGVRIISEDPLIIETYSDLYTLDAELMVSTWFPNFYYDNPGFWHVLAVGILAEQEMALAFTGDKADKLGVEWMNFISGPSLPLLADHLAKSLEIGFIPYEPTLGQYVTMDEATQRWLNLDAWYRDKGHFWVGSGPLYLEDVFPVEGVVVMRRFEDYPDPADRWLFLTEDIAEVIAD